MEQEFLRMTDELANAFADVDPEVAESEIEEALKASRPLR